MIRKMEEKDRQSVLEMMKVFYESDAVSTDGSPEIFENDFRACIEDNPYLLGYIFEEDGTIQGYAMTAKSFSTEFGRPCIWVEDLYLKPEFRCRGIGAEFFHYLETQYRDVIFRLEAEEENTHALHLYRKMGYRTIRYDEMIKEL